MVTVPKLWIFLLAQSCVIAEFRPYCHNKLVVLKQENSRLKLLNSSWECSGPASKDSSNAQSAHDARRTGLGQAKGSLCLVFEAPRQADFTREAHSGDALCAQLLVGAPLCWRCSFPSTPPPFYAPTLTCLSLTRVSPYQSLLWSPSWTLGLTHGHRQTILSTSGPDLLQLELLFGGAVSPCSTS